MPKEKNGHASELIGSPEKIINTLIKKKEDREWALKKITKDGPPHKQLQHTLVLDRLEKLVSLTKKTSGMVLKPIKGKTSIFTGPEHEKTLPIDIPTQSFEGVKDVNGLSEKLSKGPEHEILYTALLLQVIEAMIISEGTKNLESK